MKKKVALIISTIAVATGAISAGVGFTLAKYMQRKEVGQQTGYEGSVTQFGVFLDVIHQRSGDNFSWADASAVFYMYCYDSSNTSINTWVAPSANVRATISGSSTNMYVFRFDSTKYTNYNLVRFNPNGSTVPGWAWDNGSTWNSTSSIAFDSYNYNYYKINGGEKANGDGYGHTTSKYDRGKLAYNYSTSTWSWTTSPSPYNE